MYAFAIGVGSVLPTAVAGAIGPFPRTAGLASAVLGFLQLTAAAAYGIAVGRHYDGTPVPMAVAIAAAGFAAVRPSPGSRPAQRVAATSARSRY
jgi:DHA1 family bicyclomycin/chloramphenicol resistance-like MFS transporter